MKWQAGTPRQPAKCSAAWACELRRPGVRRAERYLQRLEPRLAARIAAFIQDLSADPYGGGSKPLAFPPHYRSWRLGGLRVVYVVDQTKRVVSVQNIAPRGEVHRNL